MSLTYGDMHDVHDANGWIIDTSVAVCLQTAQWTQAFLELPVASHDCPEIRVAPSAFGSGGARSELSEQLDPNNLELWETAADAYPAIVSGPFSGTDRQEVQNIIKASRRGGRSISRVDAEGVFLAKQHDFVLVTGDNRQAEIAAHNGVTVAHKGVMLEYLATICISPMMTLCSGLFQLISNSLPGDPCAMPDSYRNRLVEIHQQQCPNSESAIGTCENTRC